jgi:hypothetical protein
VIDHAKFSSCISIRSLCHFKVQQEHLPLATSTAKLRAFTRLGSTASFTSSLLRFCYLCLLSFLLILIVLLIRSLISLSQEIFILSQDYVQLFNDKSIQCSGLTPQLLLPKFRALSNQGQNHTSHKIIKLQKINSWLRQTVL